MLVPNVIYRSFPNFKCFEIPLMDLPVVCSLVERYFSAT